MKKLAIIALCLAVVSCKQAESPSSAESTHNYTIGETVSSGGVQIILKNITNINNSGIYAIHVKIKNVTSRAIDYSPFFSWGITCFISGRTNRWHNISLL